MASLRKRGNTYYAQWHDAARTPSSKRHSLRTSDLDRAESRLAYADKAFDDGQWDPWIDLLSDLIEDRVERPALPIPIGEAVDAFLEYKRTRLRPITIENYESFLTRFRDHVGAGVPLARPRPRDVDRFARSGGAAASTVETRLVMLSSLFSWAQRLGHVTRNPVLEVEAPRIQDSLPRAVREEELRAICDAVLEDQERRDASTDDRVRRDRTWTVPCFRFAYLTGLRAGELVRLVWGDVDLDRRRIRLEVQKSGRAQYLPLSRKAVAVLAAMDREGLGPDDAVFCPPETRGQDRNLRAAATNLNRYFTRYRELAGIERRLTLHSLRHGHATTLAEAGASAFTIMESMRHANVTTSQRYVSISGEALRGELDAVFG